MASESYPQIESESVTIVRPRRWPLYYAGLSATFGGLIMGTAIAWSAPALNMLRPNKTDHSQDVFPMSDGEASFVASLMPAGALVGGNVSNFFSKFV